MKNKEMIEYRKMTRKHRKALKKLVKNYADFDYGYLQDFVVTILKNMLEYYSEGNNIWQTEETLTPILETLHEALKKADVIKANYDEAKYYEDFYTYIGKNICRWWD